MAVEIKHVAEDVQLSNAKRIILASNGAVEFVKDSGKKLAWDGSQFTLAGDITVNGDLTARNIIGNITDTTFGDITVGTIDATGLASLNGGIAVDTNKFTVADNTGDIATKGTLSVDGTSTLTGTVTTSGDVVIDATGSYLKIKSPDGTQWRIKIDNNGVLSAESGF
jgi:cytoskeletal protein CcmA (bactofilin family)